MRFSTIGAQMSDEPYCELCGEQHATMKMEEVAVCDDCFASECRTALLPILGKRCCNLYRQAHISEPAICLAVYGVEHDHG
jgi:hypothetical protein